MKKLLPVILLATLAAVLYLTLQKDAAGRAPTFADYPAGDARKNAFFDYFAPLVAGQNAEVLQQRGNILEWRDKGGPGWWQRRAFAALANNYFMLDFDPEKDEDWNELLERVDTVPVSLALAQAAKESGWGTSRFAANANNYFGLWCFEPGCGEVPRQRRAGASHEIAAFNSPAESVQSYLRNLNRHRAYAGLRDIRARMRKEGAPLDGIELAAGLGQYSERGQTYVKEIRSMIRFNDLTRFDDCVPDTNENPGSC